MYNPSLNFREQIKNIAHEVHNSKRHVVSGVVTSVGNTLPYTVKVMLEPLGVETGWIPVASNYVGNNFGIVLPPPDEGTHVRVIFDLGDINSGVVIGATFNDETAPPLVEFGDAGIFHKSGSSILMKSDGSIIISSKSGASITLDGADKKVTINGNSSQSW